MRLFLIKSVTVGLGLACLVQLPGGAHPPLAGNEVILHFARQTSLPTMEIKVPADGDIEVASDIPNISKKTVLKQLPGGAHPPLAGNEVILHFAKVLMVIKVLADGDIEVTSDIKSIDKDKVLLWIENPDGGRAWTDDEGRPIFDEVKVVTDGKIKFSYWDGFCYTDKGNKTKDYTVYKQTDDHHQEPKKAINSRITYHNLLSERVYIEQLEQEATVTTSEYFIKPIKMGNQTGDEKIEYSFECSADSIGANENSPKLKWSHMVRTIYANGELQDGILFLGLNQDWNPNDGGENVVGKTRPGYFLDNGDFVYCDSYLFVKSESLENPFATYDNGKYLPWNKKHESTVNIHSDKRFWNGTAMDSRPDHIAEWEIEKGHFTSEISRKLKDYLKVMKGVNFPLKFPEN